LMERPRVLFVCTGNAVRSQMAEGWLKSLAGNSVEVLSGGTQPWQVHPFAIKVMAEAGIDISGQRAKHVSIFADKPLDFVITLCDGARDECPLFSGAKRLLHWPVHDPSFDGTVADERLAAFRTARDEIRNRINGWLAEDPFE